MKKSTKGRGDEPRKQYQRTDFPELTRGKYASRLRKSSNVVILDPFRRISGAIVWSGPQADL